MVKMLIPMLIVEVIVSQSESANHIHIVPVIVILLYQRIIHIRCSVSVVLYILSANIRLMIIPGFAENLHSCNARFVPGPSLAGTHFGPQR